MLYSEVIAEILNRTDESYVGVSEDRAKQHFKGAVSFLLQKNDFLEEDVLSLITLEDYTFNGTENGLIQISDITSEDILLIRDAFIDPEDPNGYILSKMAMDEVTRLSYSESRMPQGKDLRYYQYGKQLRFLPEASLQKVKVIFLLTLTPGTWADGYNMLTDFSYEFLQRLIAVAVANFKNEV